ncbi:MAG TPA: PIN domain-containing protein [Phycisphaerales bacterium]|nr:PIN domain-containing protein [Phycisphaerales bacterium]
MNAIDTNVCVAAFTVGDPHRATALELLEKLPDDGTVLLWQVACETGAVLERIQREQGAKHRHVDDPRKAVELLVERFRLVYPGTGVLARGWDIHLKYQVSYWDAMLLAACADAGVRLLYTQDAQSQPEIDGVTLINPFAS